MFCNKCGNKIQEDAAFCAKCGCKISTGESAKQTHESMTATNNDENQTARYIPTETKKKASAIRNIAIVAVVLVIMIVFIFVTNGSNSLNGIWEQNPDTEYAAKIEFKRKEFIITEYPVYEWTRSYSNYTQHRYQTWNNFLNFSGNEKATLTQIETYEPQPFRDSSVPGPRGTNLFEGCINYRYYSETKGTYSIFDDKIELTFMKIGSIDVYSFSRTENTITINGIRFTRKR